MNRWMFPLSFLALTAAVCAEDDVLPRGPAPRISSARLVEGGIIEFFDLWLESLESARLSGRPLGPLGPAAVREALKEDGNIRSADVLLPRASHSRTRADHFHVFDATGREIPADDLAVVLKSRKPVLVSVDGRPVDPFYLRLVSQDALIFVPQAGRAIHMAPAPAVPALPAVPLPSPPGIVLPPVHPAPTIRGHSGSTGSAAVQPAADADSLQERADAAPTDPEELLRDQVRGTFDARQTLQREQVAALRARLARLEEMIAARHLMREAIIDQRVRQLSGLPSEAAAPSLPALDGYCPVALWNEVKWVAGDPRFSRRYRNRTYLFGSQDALGAFDATPAAYVPVMDGDDVVIASRDLRRLPGSRRHGIWFRGRMFLFANDETLKEFMQTPEMYSAFANRHWEGPPDLTPPGQSSTLRTFPKLILGDTLPK